MFTTDADARASAKGVRVEMRELNPQSDGADESVANGRTPKAVRLRQAGSPSFGDSYQNHRPTDAGRPDAREQKRAYTVNEAVRLYSVSRSSLYKLIDAGKIPDVVVAGRRLIPRDAMEALIGGRSQ